MFRKTVESLLALIFGLVAAYGLIAAYAYFFADEVIFAHNDSPRYELGGDYQTTTASDGNQIALLHLKNSSARYTVLYSHGILEDIGFLRPRLELFRDHGFSVVAYDYPGFGCSSGRPNEKSLEASADAAYEYLIKSGVDPRTIIVYGRSLGSGPSVYLASRHTVGGVVLNGAFVSAFRVQTGVKILPWDHFDNLARMPFIKAPVFFVHGLADETVPAWHSRTLQAAACVPTRALWVPYALHNNVLEVAREDFWKALDEFTQLVNHMNGFDTPSAAEKVLEEISPPIPETPATPSTPSL